MLLTLLRVGRGSKGEEGARKAPAVWSRETAVTASMSRHDGARRRSLRPILLLSMVGCLFGVWVDRMQGRGGGQ